MNTINPVTAGGSVPTPEPGRRLPEKAGQTTPQNPWPLALLARKMRDYVNRMPALWVEAELIEHKQRPGTRMSFFTVKDPKADASMTVTAFPGIVDEAGPSFQPGAHVILHVKPNFWESRGTLSLRAAQVLVAGEGDLLARVEQLRRRLAAEGLFAPERKKPLPFIPRGIGLICGRNAAAMDDVLVNTFARWPSARFEIREVAVQGQYCVSEVTAALQELDAHPHVDVIVIARGGGSVEDLLPFSEEAMLRAVAAAKTPVVSAIGHEEDTPLLDLVADLRASTPTKAAEAIVPSWDELAAETSQALGRLRGALIRRLRGEWDLLVGLTSRPVLTSPGTILEQQSSAISADLVRMGAAVRHRVAGEQSQLSALTASLAALSPEATLERGYTILRDPSGHIVRSTEDLARGDLLEGVLSRGTFVVSVVGVNPEGNPTRVEGSGT